jgi:hypothetical protein
MPLQSLQSAVFWCPLVVNETLTLNATEPVVIVIALAVRNVGETMMTVFVAAWVETGLLAHHIVSLVSSPHHRSQAGREPL